MDQRRDLGSEVGCWGVSAPSLAMQRRFVSERWKEGKAEPASGPNRRIALQFRSLAGEFGRL
jgi:hypothetical protein